MWYGQRDITRNDGYYCAGHRCEILNKKGKVLKGQMKLFYKELSARVFMTSLTKPLRWFSSSQVHIASISQNWVFSQVHKMLRNNNCSYHCDVIIIIKKTPHQAIFIETHSTIATDRYRLYLNNFTTTAWTMWFVLMNGIQIWCDIYPCTWPGRLGRSYHQLKILVDNKSSNVANEH